MRQRSLPPLTLCLSPPPHSNGTYHQCEWKGGAQAFRQGFPFVATDPVSYPPPKWCDPTSFVYLKIHLRVE